jgi:N-acetylmuramoyl-L-alanine amidase
MRKLLFVWSIWLCLVIIFPSFAHAMKIVVDAGHGGSDPGAIGINGLKEKNVTLDIALKLKNELLNRGYEVILSREDDHYISLKDRVDFTNQQNADLFLSIHGNSYPKSQAKGTLVLYYDNRYPQSSYPASPQMASLTSISKSFAQQVLDSFIAKMHTDNQDIVPSSVYVVRNGTIPSILIETAFLSNAEDAALLADPNARTRMAEAIADGIQAFRPIELSDAYGHWAQAAILRLKDQGIVTGDNHLYYPERSLSRAELLTLLNRIQPFADGPTGISITTFTDLKEQHWAFPTFAKALAAGYIHGYEDGTIRPDQAVSRGEAAVIVDQFIEAAAEGVETPSAGFDDVSKDAWYSAAVNHLKALGIIMGKTPTLFEPNQTITRAEIATLLDQWMAKKTVERQS